MSTQKNPSKLDNAEERSLPDRQTAFSGLSEAAGRPFRANVAVVGRNPGVTGQQLALHRDMPGHRPVAVLGALRHALIAGIGQYQRLGAVQAEIRFYDTNNT